MGMAFINTPVSHYYTSTAQKHSVYIPATSHIIKKYDVDVDFRSNVILAFQFRADDDNDGEMKITAKPRKRRHVLNDTDVLPRVLTSAIAILGLVSSVGTLWSEYSVIITGCGPQQLSDSLERGCYLGTLVIAGLSVFVRIVTGNGIDFILAQLVSGGKRKYCGKKSFRWPSQLQITEILSLIAVLMALVTLGVQEFNGEQMDGLSGINIEMCRAIQAQNDLPTL